MSGLLILARDPIQWQCMYTLGSNEHGPRDGVTSVAISPDRRLVAAGSLDRVVRLWDATTGAFLDRFEGHQDSVYSVAFSADGKTLVSGSLDRTIKVWDVGSQRSQRSKCRTTLSGHKVSTHACLFVIKPGFCVVCCVFSR